MLKKNTKIKKQEIIEKEPIQETSLVLDLSIIKNKNIKAINNYLDNVKKTIDDSDIKKLNDYQISITKINKHFVGSIDTLMNYTDKINEFRNTIQKKIIELKLEEENKQKEEQKRLEELEKLKKEKEKLKPTNKIFLTLEDLILSITNFEQVKRIQKILPDNQDYAKVYLQEYTENTDKKKNTLLGTIRILGQYNFQKKEREAYQIKVFQNEPHTFWCSCIDHKLNSSKKNTVCKHIAFIVCKVMKLFELEFFETKKLSDIHLQELLNRFSDKSDLWKNKSLVRDLKQINLNTFKMFPTPIDDTCTFCYDELTDADINNSVCCPTCRHSYHSECMDIWLENYLRCSVCSSDIWKHYKIVKDGLVVDMNSNQL